MFPYAQILWIVGRKWLMLQENVFWVDLNFAQPAKVSFSGAFNLCVDVKVTYNDMIKPCFNVFVIIIIVLRIFMIGFIKLSVTIHQQNIFIDFHDYFNGVLELGQESKDGYKLWRASFNQRRPKVMNKACTFNFNKTIDFRTDIKHICITRCRAHLMGPQVFVHVFIGLCGKRFATAALLQLRFTVSYGSNL